MRAGGDAIRPEGHRFDIRRVRDHGHDDVGPLGDLARAGDHGRAGFG